jgi:peptidylprolyl isomerase
MFRGIFLAAMACLFSLSAGAQDLENTLYLQLKDGTVVIEMLPEKAPKHVARIKELVQQGFYDGTPFHRVIDGFMAQGGDPTGTGMGGSGQNIPAEFNDLPHVRGAVSMARASNPNSADSQFFIVLKDSNFLDKQYTVWGRVIRGMQFVDNIKKGGGNNGSVSDPDKIVSLKLGTDAAPVAEPAETKAE